MRTHSALTAIAAALALTVAARPISAQQMSLASKSAIRVAAPTDAHRVLATYDFGSAPRDIAFPRTVSVIDSAGTLTAKALVAGEGREAREIALTVTVMNSDLVLQGQTPDGVLTLVLENQNDAEAKGGTTGRWILGNARGTLRMHVKN